MWLRRRIDKLNWSLTLTRNNSLDLLTLFFASRNETKPKFLLDIKSIKLTDRNKNLKKNRNEPTENQMTNTRIDTQKNTTQQIHK